MSKCALCDGTGWVCENCGTRWELVGGGTCCGAGNNCVCNPNGDMPDDFLIIASVDDETKGKWLQ